MTRLRQSVGLTALAGLLVLALGGLSRAADEHPAPSAQGPRTWVVAQDGSGQFASIQEAVDASGKGDTILVKAGRYAEDVTIHSKERLKLVGEGMDRVTILGRERVGVFHVGKWPYGATDVEISDLTINEHGGHAMGIFNGRGIVLRRVRINGMLFGQQVQNVRVERCVIGGSETTGVQLANSQAVLVENFIHDNDHGVQAAGKSEVRLERNVITRSLFEGVVVTDQARATVRSNTIVKNGGGAAFLGTSQSDVAGNIVGLNRIGFVVAPTSRVAFAANAMHNADGDYLRAGSPPVPAPDLQSAADMPGDPRFVDPARDDYRLRADSPLRNVAGFAYLGALAPVSSTP